jgi:hypothetical protein
MHLAPHAAPYCIYTRQAHSILVGTLYSSTLRLRLLVPLGSGDACSLAALSTAVAYLRKGDCDTALVVTVSMRYAHRHLLMLQVCRNHTLITLRSKYPSKLECGGYVRRCV